MQVSKEGGQPTALPGDDVYEPQQSLYNDPKGAVVS